MRIALVGGTGNQGPPLAVRWTLSGNQVYIGSRRYEKAERVARGLEETLRGLGCASDLGFGVNQEVVSEADVVVLTIPYHGLTKTAESIRGSLREDAVVISPIVPCRWEGGFCHLIKMERSVAEEVAELLPRSRVASALHTVSAHLLEDYSKPVEGDVIVCSDDEKAKRVTMRLVEEIPKLRALEGGGLENSHMVEEMTVLLIRMGKILKRPNLGLRII